MLTLSWDCGSCQGWSSSDPLTTPGCPTCNACSWKAPVGSTGSNHFLILFGFGLVYFSPQEWIPVSNRFRSSCAEHTPRLGGAHSQHQNSKMSMCLGSTGIPHPVQKQDRTRSKPLDCQSCWVKQLLSTVGYLIQSQHGFI